VVTPLGVRNFGRPQVELGSSASHGVDARLFTMTLASATAVTVPVGRIPALLRLRSMSHRDRRRAPVVLLTSMPTRFGKSYRWPDGTWTHCG
jgi:hypothetical protein